MLERILGLPFLVILMGGGAVSMLIPAIHAAVIRELYVARVFLYSSILFLILFAMVGLAMSARPVRRQARSHLIALVGTFTLIPLMLAVPFHEAVRNTSFLNSYFEMVSSLTTTGATLFEPERLPDPVHLWRALVGWMGGFFIWVTAVAVLAPLNLGGFEVRSAAQIGQGASGATQITRVADASERLQRFAARLFPVYGCLTAAVWVALIVVGERPLAAVCHAMSTMATSGISPVGGSSAGAAGIPGELIIFLFLVFALSRLTYAADERPEGWVSLRRDPELQLGIFIVVTLPLLIFARHWFASFDLLDSEEPFEALRALWGATFTVMSFLTTTGFQSAEWAAVRDWSGLETPGLILMGLAVFGGGVATTAGGVKLLRVYALYKHGIREMERLVHPSSIGGAGSIARHIRRQGALVAWIFFMLFAVSVAVVMTAFSMTGADFEPALILTVSSLTTTGPLTELAGAEPIELIALSGWAKGIFMVAMVVGRLETLAIIALLNPDFWRS